MYYLPWGMFVLFECFFAFCPTVILIMHSRHRQQYKSFDIFVGSLRMSFLRSQVHCLYDL